MSIVSVVVKSGTGNINTPPALAWATSAVGAKYLNKQGGQMSVRRRKKECRYDPYVSWSLNVYKWGKFSAGRLDPNLFQCFIPTASTRDEC